MNNMILELAKAVQFNEKAEAQAIYVLEVNEEDIIEKDYFEEIL